MDIVNRARNILVRPGAEWAVIDAEPASVGDIYGTYLVPLGLIGPIASFIGLTVIGVSIPFLGTYHMPFLSGLSSALVRFAAVLAGAYLWALIIDALAPTFLGRKSLVAALKVSVFAATPALLGGILSLLPALGLLQILTAFYALYLLYRGLPVLMKCPPQKAAAYTAVTVLCGFVVGIVLGAIMLALHFSPLFGPGPAMFGQARDDAAAQQAVAGAIGAAAGGSDDSRKAAATLVAGVIAAGKDAAAAGQAAQAESPGPQAAGPASQEKPAAAAAAGIAAIGAFVGGGKAHVEPVDFRALEALLPQRLDSLARTSISGEKTNAAGLGASTAQAEYGGNARGRLTVKISDMGNASGLMALGKLALSIESENDTGYEKNTVIAGRKVHEKWTSAGKSSELTAFAGDRFMVEVRGDGVEMPAAESATAAIDFAKLAALNP